MFCILSLLPHFPLQLHPPCSLKRLFKPILPFLQRCSRCSRCPQQLNSICIPAVFRGLGTTESPPGKEPTNKICLVSLGETRGLGSSLLSCNAATVQIRACHGHAQLTNTLVTARLGLTDYCLTGHTGTNKYTLCRDGGNPACRQARVEAVSTLCGDMR